MNLDKELMCGFEVTEQRKRVWLTELRLLEVFIDICKRHHLEYFAAGGTLLGCVRHSGFIPWDDDVDIYMKREEYEKFLRICSDELPEYYVLHHGVAHVQIRDSRTTALLQNGFEALSSGKNCGIFIDIFPLDYVAEDYKARKKDARKIFFYDFCLETKKSRGGGQKSIKMKVYALAAFLYNLTHSEQQTAEKARNPFKKDRRTSMLGEVTFAPGCEEWVWPVDWYDGTVELPFEDIMIAVPSKYHEVLTKEYGDYMAIPENKNGSYHTCYFDTDRPYTEYTGISEEEYASLFEDYSL